MKPNKPALRRVVKMLRNWPFKDQKFAIDDWRREADCGTACCAVGGAAQLPWFLARGLSAVRPSPDAHFFKLQFGGYEDWEAAEEFFGLTEEQAAHLFSEDAYKSRNPKRETVAKRIEAFLEGAA